MRSAHNLPFTETGQNKTYLPGWWGRTFSPSTFMVWQHLLSGPVWRTGPIQWRHRRDPPTEHPQHRWSETGYTNRFRSFFQMEYSIRHWLCIICFNPTFHSTTTLKTSTTSELKRMMHFHASILSPTWVIRLTVRSNSFSQTSSARVFGTSSALTGRRQLPAIFWIILARPPIMLVFRCAVLQPSMDLPGWSWLSDWIWNKKSDHRTSPLWCGTSRPFKYGSSPIPSNWVSALSVITIIRVSFAPNSGFHSTAYTLSPTETPRRFHQRRSQRIDLIGHSEHSPENRKCFNL